MKKFIILLFCLTGCGKVGDKPTTTPTDELNTRYSTYLGLTPGQTDSNGWVSADICDGLLWNSLWSVAGGNVDIYKAQISPGEWERNANGQCTSISRDMILGLMLDLWVKRDLTSVNNLISYGEAHGFQMNSVSETDGADIMSPDIISTMYLERDKLGGAKNILLEAFTDNWFIGGQTGSNADLQVIHLLLRGLMEGSITSYDLGLLQTLANNNPDNAWFNSVFHRFKDGDQTQATNSLLNEDWFPAQVLPTNQEYCESVFLYQRDEYNTGTTTLTQDWTPCPQNIGYRPGVDLELASVVILGLIK